MTNPTYELNVDLDGVLFHFEKKAEEITNLTMTEVNGDKALKKLFWTRLSTHVKRGGKFFEEMELLPDALELIAYISNHNYFICSATGHILNAKEEKTAAVRRHFGDVAADNARLVNLSSDKAQYASPTAVLIDDRSKSIDPWVAAGGIGILHTSTANTIVELKKLGL